MKELIYKIVDAFTFGRGLKKTFSGHAVRLPTRYINYFETGYEADNFKFLETSVSRDAVVIDIGAHIGLFAAIAAQITGADGKVFAFEPAADTFKLLQQTIAINKYNAIVEARPEAMGIAAGSITFYVSDQKGDNSNSTVAYKTDRPLKAVTVPMLSIDQFVKDKQLHRVDFIKIDVEGAEYDTIRGAVETLSAFKPAVILAIHPESIIAKGDSLGDIYDIVSNLPYNISCDGKALAKDFFLNNKALIDLHLKPLA